MLNVSKVLTKMYDPIKKYHEQIEEIKQETEDERQERIKKTFNLYHGKGLRKNKKQKNKKKG